MHTNIQGQSREWPYVQTFFLARQEHGYYVLNDILRLLPEQQPYASSPAASTVPPRECAAQLVCALTCHLAS